jgi:hypothetical protein
VPLSHLAQIARDCSKTPAETPASEEPSGSSESKHTAIPTAKGRQPVKLQIPGAINDLPDVHNTTEAVPKDDTASSPPTSVRQQIKAEDSTEIQPVDCPSSPAVDSKYTSMDPVKLEADIKTEEQVLASGKYASFEHKGNTHFYTKEKLKKPLLVGNSICYAVEIDNELLLIPSSKVRWMQQDDFETARKLETGRREKELRKTGGKGNPLKIEDDV